VTGLPTATSDTPLNCDRDAGRWARDFIALFDGEMVGAKKVDEGLLISWFANAMMCGEDTYRWKLEKEGRIASEIAASPYCWLDKNTGTVHYSLHRANMAEEMGAEIIPLYERPRIASAITRGDGNG
jgi:hypothetical protein